MSVEKGMADSEGDPRVLFVINAVLSAAFASILLSAGSVVGVTEFTWVRFAALTVVLMIVTYYVTR